MPDYLAPDEKVSVLDECYRNIAKEAAELADLAKDCAPDDDLAGAVKLLGNAMERIAMSHCMAQCDAQDLAAKERLGVPLSPSTEAQLADPLFHAAQAGIEAAESASGIAPNRTPSKLVPGERRLDPHTFKDIPEAAEKAVGP